MNADEGLINRAVRKFQSDGIFAVLSSARWIVLQRFVDAVTPLGIWLWEIAPRRNSYVRFNNVEVGVKKRWLPLVAVYDDREGFEQGLIDAHRTYTSEGNRVVSVGGGFGVTAVVAAEQVGPTGHVTTYEPSTDRVAILRWTLEINGVEDRCTVYDASVGTSGKIEGDYSGEMINPVDLPACDILELDCEGAGPDIVREMTIDPDYIYIETHPQENLDGLTESNVRTLLSGYEVLNSVPLRYPPNYSGGNRIMTLKRK